jgi:glycosyltransferase involved in cell wall biosynthesis
LAKVYETGSGQPGLPKGRRMSEAVPLVSVGIPTFNRVENLRRAVASVLAQDHVRLELVISDNASDDGTVEYCEELAGGDDRVRYLRNASNAGPTENFNRVRREAAGEFLLWLGDDDVLAADYISTCVRTLVERPDAALAVGADRRGPGPFVLQAGGGQRDLLRGDPPPRGGRCRGHGHVHGK